MRINLIVLLFFAFFIEPAYCLTMAEPGSVTWVTDEPSGFLPLTEEKEKPLYTIETFSGYPKNGAVAIMNGASYYPISKSIDLVDISNAAPVAAGIYKVDYSLKTADRIAPNIDPNNTQQSFKINNKVIFLTMTNTLHQGYEHDYHGLLVIEGESVMGVTIFSSDYYYSEDKYPSCGNENKMIKDKILNKLESYKISNTPEFKITLIIDTTKCSTNEHKQETRIIDESILSDLQPLPLSHHHMH